MELIPIMGQEVTSSLSSKAEAWKRGNVKSSNPHIVRPIRIAMNLGASLILATFVLLSTGCSDKNASDNSDDAQAEKKYQPRSPHLDNNRPHVTAERGKTILIEEDN